ncbi:bifunctional UDP-sugar hydrolase/5'-nucleotidase [Diaphorobacter sp. JS3051]|uniref:bifunctional metallophosphatase/5'-nucleotidase n=1 Tax=Diaphorobacter sp. JS3051 TaxID=2792224 RepID=UPI0018C9A093|nr:5'-nucleotidase C-terminal domain-containing protein [Diaphorobacter sp. JS3051]QPN32782.1 5'-nucleotidase C-terminal domain-containing protein [Diaphorobacter sp. JS3051]
MGSWMQWANKPYGRRVRMGAVALAACGVLAACGGNDDDEAQPLELTVLHINDHHSTLDAKSKTLKLSTGGAAPVDVAVEAGGFARVTAAFDSLAKAAGANVLKLHAGDALTGTLYFNRAGADGEADAALMNTVCFDAFTLGNHEFDKGDAGLKGFLDLLKKGSCKTAVLSANVKFGAGSALNATKAPGYVQPSTVVERSGQKIGIVGLTIAGKTKASSSPDADTTFEDEVTAAQREIDKLRAQSINKIIVMSHVGYGYDKEIAAKLSGVDVIVGGDSHTLLGPDALKTTGVGTPSGAYPTRVTDKDGKNVCVVQAWEYAQVVGELKVRFDGKGEVTQCSGTPHVLIGGDFTINKLPPTDAEKKAIDADVAAKGFLRVTQPAAAATTALQPFKDRVAVFNKTNVAVVPKELCFRRVPGNPGSGGSSPTCNSEGSVHLRGGDIQQLVAQAYVDEGNAKYGGADISLQSGGGVRIALDGTVTAAQVIQVLPFGNMLFRLDVTGAEVKSMLEDGLEAVFKAGGSTGPYPYTGGLRFDVNASAAFGQRASGLEVRNAATGTWGPIDPAKTYRLFVLSFNATGGDGYKTLAAVPAARRLDIGVLDADVFFSYIDKQPRDAATGLPVLNRLPHELYSTKSFAGQ